MDYKDLSLSAVRRLVAAIEKASADPNVIEAIINREPEELMEHGRVTIGSMLALLGQTDGSTSLSSGVLAVIEKEKEPELIAFNKPPFCPNNLMVLSNKMAGYPYGSWEYLQPRLKLYQTDKLDVAGTDIKEQLADKDVLNANCLDWLLAHQDQIPESWRGKIISFWGTIYQEDSSTQYVRGMEWQDDHHWVGTIYSLALIWGKKDFAIIEEQPSPTVQAPLGAANTPTTSPLLRFMQQVRLPAKDKFCGKTLEKYATLEGNFQAHFLCKTERGIRAQRLNVFELTEQTDDDAIIPELMGGDDGRKHVTTLFHLFALLQRQSDGSEGALQVNGKDNNFYIDDEQSVLRLVYARFEHAGEHARWVIRSTEVFNPDFQMSQDDRVFSRAE